MTSTSPCASRSRAWWKTRALTSSSSGIGSSSTIARLQREAKRAVLVEHIGDAARHAGGEVAAGAAEHHHHAAGHVFAAVVAAAFHHRDGAGVAHREALAGDAVEIASPAIAPYSTVLPTMMFSGTIAGSRRRAHHDAAAGQPLADIVVGVAVKFERHAARQERAEALPGGAGQAAPDGVVRQAGDGRSAWRSRPTAWRRRCG